MNPINNIVLLFVALGYSIFVFHIALPAMAPPLIHQYESRNFPSTTGQIIRSEVTHEANSKGRVFYDVNLVYHYEVGGWKFDSARYRYAPLVRCANPAWPQNIVNAHPIGSTVQVFYNPASPAPNDALLAPGLNGDDLMKMMNDAGLFMILPLLWVFPMGWLYRIIYRGKTGGVLILQKTNALHARLPRFWPSLITLTVAVFLPGLVCTYYFGDTHPSMASVETAMAVVFIFLAGLYFCGWRKIHSGDYDLIIDQKARKVDLPKSLFGRQRVTVGLAEIAAVTVERLLKVGHTKGGVSYAYYTYAPTLRLHDKNKTFKLADWQEQGRAEAFAAWLRPQLKLKTNETA
jgi:hypothetical protein